MRHLSRFELELVAGGLWTEREPDDGSGSGGETGGGTGGNSSDLTRTDPGDRLEILVERWQVQMFGGFGDAEYDADGNMHVLATTLPTQDQLIYSHNLEVLNSWVFGLQGVQAPADAGPDWHANVIKAIASALTDVGIDAVKSNLNLLSLYQEFKNLSDGVQKKADQFAEWLKAKLEAEAATSQPTSGGNSGGDYGDYFSYAQDYSGWESGDFWDDWDITGSGTGVVTLDTGDDWWNQGFWGSFWDDWYGDFAEWWMGGSY